MCLFNIVSNTELPFVLFPLLKKSTYTVSIEIIKFLRKVIDVLKELNLNFIFSPYYGLCDSLLICIKS